MARSDICRSARQLVSLMWFGVSGLRGGAIRSRCGMGRRGRRCVQRIAIGGLRRMLRLLTWRGGFGLVCMNHGRVTLSRRMRRERRTCGVGGRGLSVARTSCWRALAGRTTSAIRGRSRWRSWANFRLVETGVIFGSILMLAGNLGVRFGAALRFGRTRACTCSRRRVSGGRAVELAYGWMGSVFCVVSGFRRWRVSYAEV